MLAKGLIHGGLGRWERARGGKVWFRENAIGWCGMEKIRRRGREVAGGITCPSP